MLAVVAMLLASQVPASDSKPTADPLGPLRAFVGTWRGEGWMEYTPGARRTSMVTETVQPKAGGEVLVVEGLGRSRDSATGGETTVHNAFAVIWYDAATKRIMFHAFKAGGINHHTELELIPGGMRWALPAPNGGHVRFTARLNEQTQWHEVGEISRDGQTWTQFMEMTLDKVPAEE